MKKILNVNYVRFMQGLTLFIISIVLAILAGGLSIIFTPLYYLVRFDFQKGLNHLGDYLKKIALSIDQLGNVFGGSMFQILFIKRGGHLFGDEDDTISYVLGRNYYKRKLNIFGKFLGWILKLIDPGHLHKSISNKIERDQDAVLRIQKDEYFK